MFHPGNRTYQQNSSPLVAEIDIGKLNVIKVITRSNIPNTRIGTGNNNPC